ncbi:DUF4337 domain-containing protein [Geomonas sp. Red69]|uniref:DUF4337 domain-containing protein n=1 Tax=Geomonas diazotrophica TaxID=2843197 RepID=A0ABX8JIE2_9BACT|nr:MULTISPECIES: DUF4337 domain-containing protein [Geomonas]MBU5638919.1 DUF4337 domain-containing protein [Geomonas diazotrophica]QWV96399.1 DUF4337 domain-containing protein [Geomonas nitrogeniifigens]QXE85466.1 DUF4337 domain-containing protein [Geomonas nitrogeniifigens]
MAEEKKEPWLNYLALTTVILAVCATLATFKGGGFSTRSVLAQSQASDQWAFYQAKSIKQSLAEMEQGQLERELLRTGDRQVGAAMEARAQALKAKIAKYDQEKAKIQDEAKKLEKERDEAQRHGRPFGLAVIFLQIAILLSSIAALLKKKAVWVAGVAVGICGLVQFANGFMLFM